MIVCKVCGTENEQGAGFCGSCGAFLEWNSEAAQPAAGPDDATTAIPVTPPPVSVTSEPTAGPSPEPVTGSPPTDPADDKVTCPVCGERNEPTRVFCRRCATELAPATALAMPVVAEPTRARSVPPVAIAGVVAVVLLGVLGAFALVSRGSPTPSSEAERTAPPSEAASSSPAPEDSAAASGAAVSPSASAPAVSASPSAPPLTGKVVFSVDRAGDADLYTWDPADEKVTRLLKAAGDQVDPSWSGDGSMIVYRDPSGLRMITAAGKPAKPPDFTHHGADRHPAWSPDGQTVVFATNVSPADNSLPGLDIEARPADDNKAKRIQLTTNKSDDWDPAWSPDGQTIVFASKRLGDAHLFTMNADGSHETEVDLGPGIYDDPTFSPDGQSLAFTRREDESSPKALYVARIDGTGMRRLTNSTANENDMAWSPDSRVIAVVRADDAYQIVLVDVATGDEIGTFGVAGAHNMEPDWR